MAGEGKRARAYLAEFVGTFLFVLAGAGAVCASGGKGDPHAALVKVALAHGAALGVLVTATGHLSGGHLNPAVTLGFLLTGRKGFGESLWYIVMQLLGGFLGAFVVERIFNTALTRLAVGMPQLDPAADLQLGLVVETVFTFFLVIAVYGTAVDPRAPKIGGLGIGLTLFCSILVVGDITGGCLNPARWFGPAMVWFANTRDLRESAVVVYTLGPCMGAILAAWLYDRILLPEDAEKPAA